MKTIESILKHAEQIGKEPGKPQDQRTLNLIKIGMRVAINEVQNWIPVEIEMPNKENGYIDRIVLIKSKNGQIIETAKYSSTQNRWLYCSLQGRNPSFWRPIDFL